MVRSQLIGVKLTDLDIRALIPINLVWTVLESPKIWTKKWRCERTLRHQQVHTEDNSYHCEQCRKKASWLRLEDCSTYTVIFTTLLNSSSFVGTSNTPFSLFIQCISMTAFVPTLSLFQYILMTSLSFSPDYSCCQCISMSDILQLVFNAFQWLNFSPHSSSHTILFQF